MIEDDADEQERAEAEALAHGLEGSASSSPQDELETASLLRSVALSKTALSKNTPSSELAKARADAVYEALAPSIARHIKPKSSRAVIWIAAGSLAAAAAVTVYVRVTREPTQSLAAAPAVSDLPAPERGLLAAQAAVSTSAGDKVARATFEREMRAYREQVLSELKRSYPTMVGMLEPTRPR